MTGPAQQQESVAGTAPKLKRVVSLTSSNTEIMAALGLGEYLVGCDANSDWPPELVARLPRLGPDLNVDLDTLERLQPDLVLASLSVPGMERIVAGLESRRLPFITLDPISWVDVLKDVRTVARTLGEAARGEALAQHMEDRAAKIATTLPQWSHPPRVMVEWWPKPVIVATRQSWVTDMLGLLGAENAFAGINKRSSPITINQALEANPDLIVCSWCGVKRLRPEVILKRQGWENVSAIRSGRVVCIPESGLGRPGPRLLEGLEGLAEALRRVET